MRVRIPSKILVAERISARQPTPGHILAICVCTYVCTYVSVTLRNVQDLRAPYISLALEQRIACMHDQLLLARSARPAV